LGITPKPSLIPLPKIKPMAIYNNRKNNRKKSNKWNPFKKHHLDYIKDNGDKLTLEELKMKLVRNLKFPAYLTSVALEAKLAGMGITPQPSLPPPTPQQRKESYNKKRELELEKEKRDRTYNTIRKYYPDGGGEVTKIELAKVKIFMDKANIYSMAKFLGVKRNREESTDYKPNIKPSPNNLYKPNTKNYTQNLSKVHLQASYITEDYNEQFGRGFRIYSRGVGGAEILDTYMPHNHHSLLDLAAQLLEQGYVVKKNTSISLLVWGDGEF
jgi:hypothetical protein